MTETVVNKQTVDERMDNIFRQLLDLYERHTQERQLMLKEKEELVGLVQLLVSQTKEIGQYEQGIRKRIQDCIKDASQTAMQSIEQKMVEQGSHAVELINQAADRCCQSMEFVSQKNHDQRLWFGWKTIISVIISGAVVGILFMWLLMSKASL